MAARLLGKLRPGLAATSTSVAGLAKPQQCLAEEPDWVVGGRYELLREATLRGPSTESEAIVGKLPAKRLVLLLALHRSSVRASTNELVTDEVVLGFLADTSRAGWLYGWAQLSGPDTDHRGGAIALRQRCRSSWEVGGRYRVTGNLALREGIELDSPEMRETRKGEEVLVLTLGLHMQTPWHDGFCSSSTSPRGSTPAAQEAGEPRLRAEVRTDSGEVGWLTVELPGGSPLLDPQNLYSPEAIHNRPLVFRTRQRRTRVSAMEHSRQGPSHRETWEVGGQYRALSALTMRQESDLDSVALGRVKVGDLLKVHEVAEVWLRVQPHREVRLRVSAGGGGSPSVVGWVSCARKSGELLVDIRDHLEFLYVTGEDSPPPVGSHLTLPPPDPAKGEVELLGVYEDDVGRQGCLSCGGAGCGLCDANRCSQRYDAIPDAEEPARCLACGGAGCGICGARRPSLPEVGAVEAPQECLACGGAGCSMCGGQRLPLAPSEHGLSAALSEGACGAPGGATECRAPASLEAAPVPWDKAEGLPVEEFGSPNPSSFRGLQAPASGSSADATSGGSPPLPGASFLPEGPECDEWRPCDDPRAELDAPGQGCAECHGGGLLGWTEPFLSCGGSRITRARARVHEHPGIT